VFIPVAFLSMIHSLVAWIVIMVATLWSGLFIGLNFQAAVREVSAAK
jgi:hypothetical protein